MTERRRRTGARLALIGAAAALAAIAVGAVLAASGVLDDDSGDLRAAALVRSASDDRTTALERATVLVSQYAGDRRLAIGSGTIISPDGLILTNAHVGDPAAPGLPVQYGLSYSAPDPAPDQLVISMFEAEDAPAKDTYIAEVAASDGYLDLAVLRITHTSGGAPIDRAKLDLPTVPVGSSSDLGNNDTVTVVGYPGVGGGFEKRINVSRGIVSGFQADPRVTEPRGWIKTDAAIAHGNSGGLAADENGAIVGVPTRIQCGSSLEGTDCNPLGLPDVQGKLRPVDLAKPLIEAARAGTGWTSPYFVAKTGKEKVTFLGWASADTEDGTCDFEPLARYPAGATKISAVFKWEGMQKDEDYTYVMGLKRGKDDKWQDIAQWTFRWRATSECELIRLNSTDALPTGLYVVSVWVGPSYDFVKDLSAGVVVGNYGGEVSDEESADEGTTGTTGSTESECDAWSSANYQDGGWPLTKAETGGAVIADAGIASLQRELGPAGGLPDEAAALKLAANAVGIKPGKTPHFRWLVLEVGGKYQAYEAFMWFPIEQGADVAGQPTPVPNPTPKPCTIPASAAKLVAWHALNYVGTYGAERWVQYTWHRTDGATITEVGAGETEQTQILYAAIPTEVRPSCKVQKPADVVITASYTCTLEGITAEYHLFMAQDTVTMAYNGFLKRVHVTPGVGNGDCPATIPSEGQWTRQQVVRGHLVCYVDANGLRDLVWTYPDRQILARANTSTLTFQELYDWWAKSGGPLD